MGKLSKRKFKFIIEKTSTGYSAYCENESIFTTGNSIPEINVNILEATNFHLEEDDEMITMDNIKVELDLEQLFEYFNVLNAKHLAQRIGMNETLLNHYVKGRKKPSKNQLKKIMEGLQQVGRELQDVTLVNI